MRGLAHQVIVSLPVQVPALFGFFCAQEVAEEQEQTESPLYGQAYKHVM